MVDVVNGSGAFFSLVPLLIEAIENKYCDFNIGVQWHPEILDDENSNLLFEKFIEASNKYKCIKRK